MGDSSISDPYLLSAYKPPKRSLKSQQKRPQRQVYASHCVGASSSSAEGYVTIVSQADGIHVHDLTALHPVISYTLGPSTSFSCPAVSRHSTSDSAVCTTYAVIESSPDLGEDESGRTVWMWKENLSGSLAERASDSKKRNSTTISHAIKYLYAPQYLPSNVILVSPQGTATLADSDLNVKFTLESTEGEDWILSNAFLFSAEECTFVSGHKSVLVMVHGSKSKHQARIQVVGICDTNSGDEALVNLGSCEIPIKIESILASSCSSSGFLSIISQDASWNTYQLSHTSIPTSILKLSPLSTPLHLSSLIISPSPSNTSSSSPTKPKPKPTSTSPDKDKDEGDPSQSISLLSLSPSSHVLLASQTSTADEICLLLWDLQFSVLLASHVFPVPASASGGSASPSKASAGAQSGEQKHPIPISLIQATKMQCILLIGSSVLVVPFSVPQRSTLKSVLGLGRASNTERWIVSTNASAFATTAATGNAKKAASKEEKMFKAIKKALESPNPNSANADVDVEKIFNEWETDVGVGEDGEGEKILGHTTVKTLLSILLPPGSGGGGGVLPPSASRLLRQLIKREVVRACMVDQPASLLSLLRERGDWETIILSNQHIPDITEPDLISTLRTVVQSYRLQQQQALKQKSDTDAMQIDTEPTPASAPGADSTITPTISSSNSTSVPTLDTFLKTCIEYKPLINTPAALRAAVKASFKDAEDVMCLLEILDRWIETSSQKQNTNEPKQQQNENIPPLNQILAFTIPLLDSTFLHLLSFKPAHDVLRNLAKHVQAEINVSNELQGARGPLDDFTRRVKSAKEPSVSSGKKGDDWRRRRTAMREGNGMVGDYRLEELVL